MATLALDDVHVALRAAPLFADTPEVELRAIAVELAPRSYPPRQAILTEGETSSELLLIHSGEAGVVGQDLTGQPVKLATVGPGTVMGEIGLVRDMPRTATVIALTPVEVFALPREAFLRLSATCPDFAAHVRQRADMLELDSFVRRASPFAHLPGAAVSELAEALRPVRTPAGDDVVREGDQGDYFYLVRAGQVEVLKGAKRVQILQKGDCFGEIALFTRRPRTATVRAMTEVELYALDRERFQEVVERYPEAHAFVAELVRIRAGTDHLPAISHSALTLASKFLASTPQLVWLVLAAGIVGYGGFSFLALSTGAAAFSLLALASGAFLGPVTYVVYLAERDVLSQRVSTLATTFLLGAGLGVPVAMRLEQWIGVTSLTLAGGAVVALIEELAKLLGVAWLLWRPSARFRMDGIIYGAAAGMGFAAVENLLYGLNRLDTLSYSLATISVRTLAAPLAHGMWTAILCAAIWQVKGGGGRPRLGWPVLAGLAASVTLHTLWDWPLLSGVWYALWLIALSLAGLALLARFHRSATSEQKVAALALNPELAEKVPSRSLRLHCRHCSQMAPAGSHYCVRCGLALTAA